MPYDKTAILNAINNSRVICAQGKQDVRNIIEALIGEPLEEPIPVPPTPPKTYRCGTKFDGPGGSYILACVGHESHDLQPVTMIDLHTGNRYREAVFVAKMLRVTESEMIDICGLSNRHEFTEEIPF